MVRLAALIRRYLEREPHYPEVDLEAATRDGDRAYWLTSHGRNSKGKLKEERLKFFAPI